MQPPLYRLPGTIQKIALLVIDAVLQLLLVVTRQGMLPGSALQSIRLPSKPFLKSVRSFGKGATSFLLDNQSES
jgi:hypothetical protein